MTRAREDFPLLSVFAAGQLAGAWFGEILIWQILELTTVGSIWLNSYAVTILVLACTFCNAKFSATDPP